MKDQKLVSVSVFYKNDKATGFGCTMTPEMYQAIDEQCEAVWREFKQDDSTDDAIAGTLITQLDALVHVKPFTQAQQCLAIMNILMLVDHGYLANDEFNGVQYCYAPASVADLITTTMFD